MCILKTMMNIDDVKLTNNTDRPWIQRVVGRQYLTDTIYIYGYGETDWKGEPIAAYSALNEGCTLCSDIATWAGADFKTKIGLKRGLTKMQKFEAEELERRQS